MLVCLAALILLAAPSPALATITTRVFWLSGGTELVELPGGTASGDRFQCRIESVFTPQLGQGEGIFQIPTATIVAAETAQHTTGHTQVGPVYEVTGSTYGAYWETVAGHNGAHEITVEVIYSVQTGVDGQGNPIVVGRTEKKTDTFNVGNLALNNTTAAPHDQFVRWDPETASTVTLSCQATGIKEFTNQVTYTIRDPVTNGVIRQVTHNVDCPGNDSFLWDGTDNSATPMPKGVYVYSMETPENSGGQHDRDKSLFLTTAEITSELIAYDESNSQGTIRVRYTLADSYAATQCHLLAIDPDLEIDTNASVPATVGVQHTVDLPLTFEPGGWWTFLLAPVDNGAERHVAHQDKPAQGRAAARDVWKIITPVTPPAGQPRPKSTYGFVAAPAYITDAGGVNKQELKANAPVTWSITLGGGATATIIDPATQQAPIKPIPTAWVRFNHLPDTNAGFGPKTVAASRGVTKTTTVRLFYVPNVNNHPLIVGATTPAYSNTVPNWFYYILQLEGVSDGGDFLYDPDIGLEQTGVTRWEARPADDPKWPNLTGWQSFLGPFAYSTASVLADWGNPEKLDNVAWICRHEGFHRTHYIGDWGAANRVPAQDADPNSQITLSPGGNGDWLKDAMEGAKAVPAAAGDMGHPANTMDPLNWQTNKNHWMYGATWTDAEEYTLHKQGRWTNGSANTLDWAVLGWQWLSGI